jgi:hypothetical protein
MRVRRAIVFVIAALVMWTAVSFLMLALTNHASHDVRRLRSDVRRD